ncbi:Spindle pole body component alp14 [Fulvia fulva]|uniref:Spindle pole body component alp14 n=1 Tax=Passalora fulva TaxID=5499 RepID=A0A9Q8LGY9_PASFU|nr:Spindle pole body component alp14 [Fulvia fulva]KAK4624774.1 Spindle pole body component alp14 [Fulvia fulva]KAK4624950.1 Spindle pole body component alp14 [Fulvia fulva]UJO17254.1 Spindle pole body component alp14 [Fulvia fulva]WPV14968.1 Spindle pole body component alp14 [Fulvia fulva]WPV30135.1 Spindle pole body component alp14 [Fulvia fulva]
MSDDPEEWAKLPLAEQFAHKNWKARKGGYETAANQFKTAQPTDTIVKDFVYDSQLWKGAVGDSNVAAQQEALNAYNAFLDAAGTEGARRTRGVTVGPVVEKGLTGRPAAKASAQEALLLLIELDKADPVIEELLGYFSHKLPKIIAATLEALAGIVRAYGMKIVEPKPILKLLPKIYGHADKNVRAQGQNLTVEMYRWLREAMKPLFWNELKEVQQKDLDKLFEPVKAEPTPKQERLLRSQQAAKEQEEAAGGGNEEAEEEGDEGGEIDLEPEFEAVDVLAKVPKDFNDRLASTKWKDRKEALDETFTAVNVPAIQPGSFDDIIRGCAKSMKDANIAVVTIAANVVECLAKGLRKDFSKYRSSILASMLERFKEKKASVTDAIGAACDAVFSATSLGDVQADVLEALKSKNPQVKENTAKFLTRALRTTREAPTIEQTKEICEGAKKLLTESAAPLRDAGSEVMGVLWKIMGDRNMLAHFEGLDDIRKNKIKEVSDAAEVKAKWKPKAAAPPPKAAAPAGRKPALGTKRPAAKKAAPPKSASPPLDEDAPALQPRPTTRPGAKPGGLKPPGGLKAPGSGLARPGMGLKAPSAGAASPKRQAPVADDPPPPSTPKPSAGAGRGLAGRPLGKPALAPTSPSAAPRADPASSALSAIERQELSDLRAEVDLARQQASDLRTDKLRLTSQVAELQVQNAQLIEDHTRDVLQIKAKETQLVRARSDAESAEDRANSLSKEIDRLKREISRLGRNQAGRDSPIDSAPTSPRPAYGSSRSFNVPSARGYGNIDGYSDGKENQFHDTNGKLRGGYADARDRALSGTSRHSRPESNGNGSGRATPSDDRQSNLDRSQGEGVESWRRAAEVTQNLKARIEMMKARQNIGRGQ